MKAAHWVTTGLLCLLMTFSAGMYILNHDEVAGFFTHLGFPLWMIYPLAVAKILGIVAILSRKSLVLKEWAYAGFAFDLLMAFAAHWMAGDGIAPPALLGTVLVFSSYVLDGKLHGNAAFPAGLRS